MSDEILPLGVRIRGYVPTDQPALGRVAKGDNHTVLAPTHVVEKDGEIVGFLSIGAIPTVFIWMHSTKTGPRDSMCVQNFLDNTVGQFAAAYMVPCKADSPFHKVMPRLGYEFSFNAGVFFKSLIKG